MITYIHLLLKHKQYDFEFHRIGFIISVFKYLTYLSLIVQIFFLKKFLNSDHSIATGKILALANETNPLFAIIVASLLLAHFSVKLTRPLPIEPFWRFYGRNMWYLNAQFLFPLVSSNAIFILGTFIIVFFGKGVIYFLLFYIIFLHSYRIVLYRIIYLVVTIGLYNLKYPEHINILCFFACIGLIYLFDRYQLVFYKSKLNFDYSNYLPTSMVNKKEIEYIKYYGSERFYVLLACLFATFFIYLIYTFDGNENISFLIWIYMFLSVFPISFTIFNSFGMDYSILRKLFFYSEHSISYQQSRYQTYKIFSYFLNSVIAISFLISTKEPKIFLRYVIGSAVFTEIMFTLALFHSIFLHEPKETKFRYGQYLRSKNLNFQQLIQIFVVVLFIVIDRIFGFSGILGIYLCYLIYKNYFYEENLRWSMNYQHRKLT